MAGDMAREKDGRLQEVRVRHTFVLVLPDAAGELGHAVRLLHERGLAVRGASFNKVIDVHTCFVEVEGTAAQVAEAEKSLRAHGLLVDQAHPGSVQLVECRLAGGSGDLESLLDLAGSFGLSISYLKVADDGDDAADGRPLLARLGLFADDRAAFRDFVKQAHGRFGLRLLVHDDSLECVDNNLLYVDFARHVGRSFGFSAEQEDVLMVSMNRIIQNLERTTADPFKPFDYVGRFAEDIASYRAEAYRRHARVSRFDTARGVRVLSIEPPCGSTTWVFDLPDTGERGTYLVIDGGYACYREELLAVLREELPDWDAREHVLFLTHADIDHAGTCTLFDKVHAVDDVIENFRLERAGERDWRERTELFYPYCQITNMLTGYEAPDPARICSLGGRPAGSGELIARALDRQGRPARFKVGPLDFEVWQGAGGHVRGETVLIERGQRLCVSGDIFINIHAETKEQKRFNALSPFLMMSVDTVPDLERQERAFLPELLERGSWQVLGGHGPVLEYVKE